MADEEGHTAGEGGPEKSDDAKGDPDVWKWVKNVAGIAAIVVTLSGAATGVYKLYLEFVSDRDSHEIAKAAEERQLKLGQAQIDAQIKQYEIQGKQHEDDARAEDLKRKSELEEKNRQENALEKKDGRESLTQLINKMFSDPTDEGDLASLFEYVHREDESREIVENAVLAKLENPRSQEEIDLGFRVLAAAGPSGIDAVIQANCAARKRYEKWMHADFVRRYHKKKAGQPQTQPIVAGISDPFWAAVESASTELVREQSLNDPYLLALVFEKWRPNLQFPMQDELSDPPISKEDDKLTLDLSEFVIERSNSVLDALFHKLRKGDLKEIDLASAYITLLITKGKYEPWIRPLIKCNGCFLEQDDFEILRNDLKSWLLGVPNSEIINSLKTNGLGSGYVGRFVIYQLPPNVAEIVRLQSTKK